MFAHFVVYMASLAFHIFNDMQLLSLISRVGTALKAVFLCSLAAVVRPNT